MNAIFLAASVPEPRKGDPEHWSRNIDPMAYSEVIAALAEESAKRAITLVYGGHPSITRFLARLGANLRAGNIRLYQSDYFRKQFPDENRDVTDQIIFTENVDNDRDRSLSHMRDRMMDDQAFGLGIFMGGMGGLREERDLFLGRHPDVVVWPWVQLGGQTAELFADHRLDGRLARAEAEAFSPGGRIARALEFLTERDATA